MEVFLAAAALIFLFFGALFLLSPGTIEKIAKVTNSVVFTIDDRIHAWRRPLGVIFS